MLQGIERAGADHRFQRALIQLRAGHPTYKVIKGGKSPFPAQRKNLVNDVFSDIFQRGKTESNGLSGRGKLPAALVDIRL